MARGALLRTVGIVALVVAVVLVIMLARRQTQGPAPAVLYNVGTLQPDGTVLYSLLFYSGPEARRDLTFMGKVPADASLVEAVIAPAGARFAPETASTNSATWEVASVPAHTVLGPFTYRLQFSSPATHPPRTLPARATWTAPGAGSVEATMDEGSLQPLADRGALVLGPAGTLNDEGEPWPVEVAGTGIWLFAPEGAVAEPVELTFTRLATDTGSVPQGMADTWWCAMVSIEADAPVTLSKPVLLGLPTRQPLTVGIPVQLLVREGSDEAWQTLPGAEGVRIAGLGDLAAVMVSERLPAMLAAGVATSDRQAGIVSAQNISGFGFQGGFGSGFNTLQGSGQFGLGGFGKSGFDS